MTAAPDPNVRFVALAYTDLDVKAGAILTVVVDPTSGAMLVCHDIAPALTVPDEERPT